MNYADSVLDLIGNTPLVKLNRVTEGIAATVLVKVEYLNPGGSSKDRIATRIIDAAEASGDLKPGGTIVEPTSGNTGVGLALVALQRGYRMIFVVPDKFTGEKTAVLRAYGAEVVEVPTNVPPEHPDSYYSVSDRLAREIPGAFKPNQFANPNGPRAHYETTGPEIWRDTQGQITHFVSSMGTTGTIMGTSRFLKEQSPTIQIVGVQPTEGSSIPGIRRWPEAYLPRIYEAQRVDRIMDISQQEAEDTTRALAAREGLFAGISSGGAVAAALQLSREVHNAVIVAIICDRGDRYLSTGVFPDH